MNIRESAEAIQRGHKREAVDRLDECRTQMPSDLGIEWQYLMSRVNRASRLIAAHRGAVNAVRFAPSGELLASARRRRTSDRLENT